VAADALGKLTSIRFVSLVVCVLISLPYSCPGKEGILSSTIWNLSKQDMMQIIKA